jgi:galactose mutarotase-like enzyme
LTPSGPGGNEFLWHNPTMADLETVTLNDPSSSLTATYVPGAGMVGTSLSDDGVELLGQRRGLHAYMTTGKTMGIPILYPWANRLSANTYGVDKAAVTLTPGIGGVRTDQHGVVIHGILAAYEGWQVTGRTANRLTAELDYGGTPRLLVSFPFPHLLTVDVTLADRVLTVKTTVTATTRADVPLCFGFHPYLRIPDVPRGEWQMELPAMRYCPVNAWLIPSGETEDHAALTETLGDRYFDESYDEVKPGSVFAISGGDRRLEVHFDEGYSAAQVFSPSDDEVICFEPMCAPTDSLRRGTYRVATEGEPATATFSIHVVAA